MMPLQHNYSYSLNSDDLHDPDLALSSAKTHGGTMILWKKEYDPYVKIQPPKTSSFLAMEFSPPGLPTTVHICVYLPTAGKEGKFVDNLAQMNFFIIEM